MSLFAHAARRIGLDHNPLRRPTDRVECWARLTVTIVILLITPTVAALAARTTYRDGVRAEASERASRNQAAAVLTQDATYSSVSAETAPTVLTFASWQGGGTTPRTGWVRARAGATAGATVLIWVDADGVPTDPPRDHNDTLAATIATALLIPLIAVVTLGIAHLVLHMFLERSRLAMWQREWQQIEPRWSGRHP
jgi:hypothetical protein